MEYCGAGSVADIMKLRNKVVSITSFCWDITIILNFDIVSTCIKLTKVPKLLIEY